MSFRTRIAARFHRVKMQLHKTHYYAAAIFKHSPSSSSASMNSKDCFIAAADTDSSITIVLDCEFKQELNSSSTLYEEESSSATDSIMTSEKISASTAGTPMTYHLEWNNVSALQNFNEAKTSDLENCLKSAETWYNQKAARFDMSVSYSDYDVLHEPHAVNCPLKSCLKSRLQNPDYQIYSILPSYDDDEKQYLFKKTRFFNDLVYEDPGIPHQPHTAASSCHELKPLKSCLKKTSYQQETLKSTFMDTLSKTVQSLSYHSRSGFSRRERFKARLRKFHRHQTSEVETYSIIEQSTKSTKRRAFEMDERNEYPQKKAKPNSAMFTSMKLYIENLNYGYITATDGDDYENYYNIKGQLKSYSLSITQDGITRDWDY